MTRHKWTWRRFLRHAGCYSDICRKKEKMVTVMEEGQPAPTENERHSIKNQLDCCISMLSQDRWRYVAGVPASLSLAYSVSITTVTVVLLTAKVIYAG